MRRRDESLPHHADQKSPEIRTHGLVSFDGDSFVPAQGKRQKPKTVRRTKWYWIWRGRLR